MLKKILIIFTVIAVVIIGAVYIYRYTIIRYYGEKIIRENLPGYIKIDRINFDFANNKISLINFKVLNPPEFSSECLLSIGSISCKYRIIGRPIPRGLEIMDVLFKGAEIDIERLKDGRINAVEMGNFIKSSPPKETKNMQPPPAPAPAGSKEENKLASSKKISDIIKLPGSFTIKDAKIEFLDALPYDKPHLITIESINGDVSMGLNEDYSKILNLAFTLKGKLNGAADEAIKWVASLNPTTPRLTMSNRFDVSGLDIVAFEPYYDRFSPFVFDRGRFSGILVFDFDNGAIGSTNEIRLSGIRFFVKPGYENAQMWETNVQDLMRYFTTTSGDIVFDFKLKGDMTSPVFYLGPISKRALTSMAIDKISSVVDQVANQKGGAVGKTKDYIGILKGFINK